MRFPLLLLLGIACASAQTWSDRGEYDLALAARAQAVPADRLKLLEQWKAKYPASPLRHARAELTLTAAQSLNDTATMLGAAQEMLAADPESFAGLYWVTILQPGVKPGSPEGLASAETAAKKLLEKCPAFFPSSEVAAERARTEALAKRTLGWVAWQRNDAQQAERNLRSSVEADPANATASAWLGTLIASAKLGERQPEAIWYLTRAAFLDGDGALPPGQRSAVRELLNAVYGNYHGSADGLDEIGQKTRLSPLPPPGFTVESTAEVVQHLQDQELARTNPDVLVWLKIRRRLEAKDGEAQFQTLTGTLVQGLKGAVVRCNTPSRPTEVTIGFIDPAAGEAVLKLDSPFSRCAEAGTVIQFDGKPSAFTREPFLLTIATERQSIKDWPGTGKH